MQVNLRQNPPPTSILKQTHLQQMVTQEGSINPICYNSCTLPLNIGKTRTKFLNLRDSVKKSPTKSTAKVSGPGERFSLWSSVSFDKVSYSREVAAPCLDILCLLAQDAFLHLDVIKLGSSFRLMTGVLCQIFVDLDDSDISLNWFCGNSLPMDIFAH